MFKEIFTEAKDMTKEYDGFYVLNVETGKRSKYPYIKGKNHTDVEAKAIADEKKLAKKPNGAFIVDGFVPKGEYSTHNIK